MPSIITTQTTLRSYELQIFALKIMCSTNCWIFEAFYCVNEIDWSGGDFASIIPQITSDSGNDVNCIGFVIVSHVKW